MEEKILNEKESLELISQMIRNTQKRFERKNAAPNLAFGYATVILSVIIWLLINATNNYWWNLLWFLIPILGNLALVFIFPKRKKIVKTYVDKAIDSLWQVLGFCMLLSGAITIFIPYTHFPILFLEVFLMGIATSLTGLISKIKIMTVSGFLTILSSILFLTNIVKGINVILLFGAIFFIFMVIPGHILYAKKRVENV